MSQNFRFGSSSKPEEKDKTKYNPYGGFTFGNTTGGFDFESSKPEEKDETKYNPHGNSSVFNLGSSPRFDFESSKPEEKDKTKYNPYGGFDFGSPFGGSPRFDFGSSTPEEKDKTKYNPHGSSFRFGFGSSKPEEKDKTKSNPYGGFTFGNSSRNPFGNSKPEEKDETKYNPHGNSSVFNFGNSSGSSLRSSFGNSKPEEKDKTKSNPYGGFTFGNSSGNPFGNSKPEEKDKTKYNPYGGFDFGGPFGGSPRIDFGSSTPEEKDKTKYNPHGSSPRFDFKSSKPEEKDSKTKSSPFESASVFNFGNSSRTFGKGLVELDDGDFFEESEGEEIENSGDGFDAQNSWKDEIPQQRISLLQSRIERVKRNLCIHTQEFPQSSFESWEEVQTYLKKEFDQILSTFTIEKINKKQIQSQISNLERELLETKTEIQNLLKKQDKIEKDIIKAKKSEIEHDNRFCSIEKNHERLKHMCNDVSLLCENEYKMNVAIERLFEQKKSFENFNCFDISKLLWKMDLVKYQRLFAENQINGKFISMMNVDWTTWKQIGIEKRDCFYMTYYFEMFQIPGFYRTFYNDDLNDCVVCSHNTPEKTIHLLEEYGIFIEKELILRNNYCTPILIFPQSLQDLNIDFLSENGKQIMFTLTKWRKLHEIHLKTIRKYHKQCNSE